MSQKDFVLPFQVKDAAIRGRVVRIEHTLNDILSKHQYPPVIEGLIAEIVALGSVLATGFKYKGVFTFQVLGNGGAVRVLVIDVTSDGGIRACAKYDDAKLEEVVDQAEDLSKITIQQLFGGGYLAFTIEQEHEKDRYQGMVELVGSTLSECMHHYFRQSEQLETGIVVASRLTTHEMSDSPFVASGIMLQRMPPEKGASEEEHEDLWIDCMTKLGTLSNAELLDPNSDEEQILYKLFWEGGVKIFDKKEIESYCRCSKDKIEKMLSTFVREDLEGMVVNDKISIKCEFCSKMYDLEPSIIEELQSEPTPSSEPDNT